jgi:hypothetical protein
MCRNQRMRRRNFEGCAALAFGFGADTEVLFVSTDSHGVTDENHKPSFDRRSAT